MPIKEEKKGSFFDKLLPKKLFGRMTGEKNIL